VITTSQRQLSMWRQRLCSVVLLAGLLVVLCVSSATAGTDAYCSRDFSAYETCTGYFHTSITASHGNNVHPEDNRRVCAGAYDTNGNFYGSYFCGSGAACHVYGGDPLTPAVHNGTPYITTDVGISQWSQTPTIACPVGS
jgi:hypothetical protein